MRSVRTIIRTAERSVLGLLLCVLMFYLVDGALLTNVPEDGPLPEKLSYMPPLPHAPYWGGMALRDLPGHLVDRAEAARISQKRLDRGHFTNRHEVIRYAFEPESSGTLTFWCVDCGIEFEGFKPSHTTNSTVYELQHLLVNGAWMSNAPDGLGYRTVADGLGLAHDYHQVKPLETSPDRLRFWCVDCWAEFSCLNPKGLAYAPQTP